MDPIEGLRAIAHASVVFLHAAVLTSSHLPSDGPVWVEFVKSKWRSTALAGGVQVDVMFVIAGYLLVWNFLWALDNFTPRNENTVLSFLIRRVARLLPCIMVVSIAGFCAGDFGIFDASVILGLRRIFATWLFILNYLPCKLFGSFTLSPCWSCCVDVHTGEYGIFIPTNRYRIMSHFSRRCFHLWHFIVVQELSRKRS